MLVNGKFILNKALENHYALGAFNANNMEFVQAIIKAAEEEEAPVFLQISQGAINYAGMEMTTAMVKEAANNTKIPVVLHLDHSTNFEQNIKALKMGFTSLMFDGSNLSYEENIKITSDIVRIAHSVDIPVEAELGKVTNIKDNLSPDQIKNMMTDPAKAKDFVEKTKVDFLAVAIGNVHKMEKNIIELDIERLKEINKMIPQIPLVLHGSSGVSFNSLQRAIKYGLSKINVATQLNIAFLDELNKILIENKFEKDIRKILGPCRDKVKQKVKEYIQILGSSGKAFL